jgi:hypothetical protein
VRRITSQDGDGRETMRRGTLVAAVGVVISFPSLLTRRGRAQPQPPSMHLASAPIELGDDWPNMAPQDALKVIARVREVALANIRLLSDRQPERIRVEDHRSGPPRVWLHKDTPGVAWIIVDIGARRWAQLAYQFGHELGHVLCNSWLPGTDLKPPTHWLEEALVEAFSIRNLALLADSWERNPPFPGNSAYGQALREYREEVIKIYRDVSDGQAVIDIAGWFRDTREALDRASGIDKIEGPGVLAILAELERDPACVEDMGALNRWPQRSAVPIGEYLHLWQTSCAEIQAPGLLPRRLRELFAVT